MPFPSSNFPPIIFYLPLGTRLILPVLSSFTFPPFLLFFFFPTFRFLFQCFPFQFCLTFLSAPFVFIFPSFPSFTSFFPSISLLPIRSPISRSFPYTVEPPVSDRTKCKDLVVVYGRWSLTRIESQGTSSEKWSGHIFFMEDNLLHAISKLRHV